ncbi:hypothetical protein AS188_05765 [Kocuria flava]|uniref:CAAX prenyl protease 2/Lysostaphin resistance protein A-like domain-containing protein n=1 Tax=Kocuria flava TaxID=446860 RepID=A0A0U2NYC6_9MICC|nr:type II CAAX endopeptidase family protein [Kocuria flava]ALU39341.1 hypothetical protein AS188_05765 [Kocuria flava]GEO93592.1 hypothetical protein KFL01_28980 [Kocuria flava]
MTTRTVPWAPAGDDARPGPPARRLPYHRLGHADPAHRWWKPLVELLVFGAVYVLLSAVLGIVWTLWLIATRGEGALDELLGDLASLDIMDPALLFMTLFSVVLMIPAIVVARLVTGPRPLGLLLSVTGRLRWGFLVRTTLLALAVYAVGHGLLLVLELATTGSLQPVAPPEPPAQLWLIVPMIVLLVPLQCAAEELVFRGYLLQTVGRWVRSPALAVLLPVPLFTFAHLYDVWGLLAVAAMAVVAGWLSWRTGGLEAAIGLHVVNNVLAFSLAAAGWADPMPEESTWVSLASALPLYLVFAWLVVRDARRRGIEVTRTVPAVPAPAPLPPAGGGPGGSGGWVCPGPPACPGHWAAPAPAPGPRP